MAHTHDIGEQQSLIHCLQIKPVQKQTRAGQRTRFKAIVVIGDSEGHIGLGIKTSKEVATAIRAAIIIAKLSVVPIRRGYWGTNLGEPHSIPVKESGKCGSVTVRVSLSIRAHSLKLQQLIIPSSSQLLAVLAWSLPQLSSVCCSWPVSTTSTLPLPDPPRPSRTPSRPLLLPLPTPTASSPLTSGRRPSSPAPLSRSTPTCSVTASATRWTSKLLY